MLTKHLKQDGHSRYSETLNQSFKKFEKQYLPAYSDQSLQALKSMQESSSDLLNNIDKMVCNKEVKTYSQRLKVELERLISLHKSGLESSVGDNFSSKR
ncbi:MAG: hypothetical protein QF441_01130 [Bacteriovoracaceae bacterium]|nr:hypothetical protein [Bacteriovoracaceae bacterium]